MLAVCYGDPRYGENGAASSIEVKWQTRCAGASSARSRSRCARQLVGLFAQSRSAPRHRDRTPLDRRGATLRDAANTHPPGQPHDHRHGRGGPRENPATGEGVPASHPGIHRRRRAVEVGSVILEAPVVGQAAKTAGFRSDREARRQHGVAASSCQAMSLSFFAFSGSKTVEGEGRR
jgi:hypothetical protein